MLKPSDVDEAVTQNAMISFSTCFGFQETSVVYTSTPITTGKNYLDWLQLGAQGGPDLERGDSVSRETLVTSKNIEEAILFVRKVRAKYSEPVIDPTRLENINNWDQGDYHKFWIKVIRQLVSTIVFANGWEYSNGSTLEYICGLEKGISLLTHDFQPLTPDAALIKLEIAGSKYKILNVQSDIIEEAILFLEDYLAKKGSNSEQTLET